LSNPCYDLAAWVPIPLAPMGEHNDLGVHGSREIAGKLLLTRGGPRTCQTSMMGIDEDVGLEARVAVR
jgi:hypothetical protein